MGHALSARLLLGILVVTATTGGFTLGYFVGKSAVSPSGSSAAGQQLKEGESLPLIPASRPNPVGEGPSEAVAVPSVLQTPSPESKQSVSAPPPPEKPAARTETKDSGKGSPAGRRTPSAPEVKASSAEKGSAGRSTVSRTAGPGDQAAAKSSPPEGVKDGSAGSSSDNVVYTVQAGAFRSQKDAEALKRKLEAKKYKASIKKEEDAKGVFFFKVRTGEFENRKEASVFALKLKKTDGLNAFAMEKK